MMPSWRKKIFVAALAGLTLCLAVIQIADARSLSGGRSMGRQSSTYSQWQSAAPPQRPVPVPQRYGAPGTPPPAAQPQRNRWLGPLAGVATGLGIGALMSHFGMGGGMGGGGGSLLLLIGLAIGGFFLFRQFFGKPVQRVYDATPPTWQNTGGETELLRPIQYDAAAARNESDWLIPASFDSEGFKHFAEVNFVRLQAAWDTADLNDILEFTTPEMFAEIKLKLNDCGTVANHTDVANVSAQLLGLEALANDSQMATVQFSGLMSEEIGAPAKPFKEVWNYIRHDMTQQTWRLAGIQQPF